MALAFSHIFHLLVCIMILFSSLVSSRSLHHQASTPHRRGMKTVRRAKMLSARSKRFQNMLDDQVSPVSLHDIGGDFTMPVYVGTPPQELQVVVDTGSDLFWIQCSEMHLNDYFDDQESQSFRPITCNETQCDAVTHECDDQGYCFYQYLYGGGSESFGRVVSDVVSLRSKDGGLVQFDNIAFGCGDDDYGFVNGMEGIIGFANSILSFPTQIRSEISSRFSYCLQFQPDSSLLLFGDEASIQEVSTAQSTPILIDYRDPSLYFISLTGMAVGTTRISLPLAVLENTGGMVIDSGTTLTYLPSTFYDSVLAAFASSISLPAVDASLFGLDMCYDTLYNTTYVFPSLQIQLENALLSPPLENYFFAPDPEGTPGIVCLAMASSDTVGLNVFGNMIQQNYQVLYDTDSSTITFSPTQCDQL